MPKIAVNTSKKQAAVAPQDSSMAAKKLGKDKIVPKKTKGKVAPEKVKAPSGTLKKSAPCCAVSHDAGTACGAAASVAPAAAVFVSPSTKGYSTLDPSCDHYGVAPIVVGKYVIYPAGVRYFQPGDLDAVDVIVPLTSDSIGKMLTPGHRYDILCAYLPDRGGVPDNWKAFLEADVIPLLQQGKKVMPYCFGSHGRTGVFIASLIALLESAKETPDPIAAARERHCYRAVESEAQATAVFALRGRSLPAKYKSEFRPAKVRSKR